MLCDSSVYGSWSPEVIQVCYLLIGWLLGLIGAVAVEIWKSRRKLSRLKIALRRDMADLKAKLAVTYYLLAARRGLLDLAEVQWVHSKIEHYTGQAVDDSIKSALMVMSACTETDFANAIKTQAKPEDSRLTVRELSLPLTHLSGETMFDLSEEQLCHLHDILFNLASYNGFVEEYHRYMDVTFYPGIRDDQAIRANSNLNIAEKSLREISKSLADKCDRYSRLF